LTLRADLEGGELLGTHLDGAKLKGAKLSGAKFNAQTVWRGADLPEGLATPRCPRQNEYCLVGFS
jgi:uncharacterized protein YjbI with pentapeptide repeats